MPTITGSNIGELSDRIDTLGRKLNSLRDHNLSSSKVDGYTSMFEESRGKQWPDKVGEKYNAHITDLKDKKVKTIKDSVQGNFRKMIENTSNIKNRISDYNTALSNKRSAEYKRSQIKDDEQSAHIYSHYTSEISKYQTEMDNALRDINTYISNYPTYIFEGSSGSTGGANGANNGDTQSGLRPFNGDERLLYDTYEYTDDEGKTHQYEILVNSEDGSVIVGNAEEGYRIYCVGEDGAVYAGYIKEGQGGNYNMESVAYLITDGHQNDYNSGWQIGPSDVYGRNGEISPFPAPASKTHTVTINGQQIRVGGESSSDGSVGAYFANSK